jgi:hypothetical protein
MVKLVAAQTGSHGATPGSRPLSWDQVACLLQPDALWNPGRSSTNDIDQCGPATMVATGRGLLGVVATIIGTAGYKADALSLRQAKQAHYWTKVVLPLFLLAPTFENISGINLRLATHRDAGMAKTGVEKRAGLRKPGPSRTKSIARRCSSCMSRC